MMSQRVRKNHNNFAEEVSSESNDDYSMYESKQQQVERWNELMKKESFEKKRWRNIRTHKATERAEAGESEDGESEDGLSLGGLNIKDDLLKNIKLGHKRNKIEKATNTNKNSSSRRNQQSRKNSKTSKPEKVSGREIGSNNNAERRRRWSGNETPKKKLPSKDAMEFDPEYKRMLRESRKHLQEFEDHKIMAKNDYERDNLEKLAQITSKSRESDILIEIPSEPFSPFGPSGRKPCFVFDCGGDPALIEKGLGLGGPVRNDIELSIPARIGIGYSEPPKRGTGFDRSSVSDRRNIGFSEPTKRAPRLGEPSRRGSESSGRQPGFVFDCGGDPDEIVRGRGIGGPATTGFGLGEPFGGRPGFVFDHGGNPKDIKLGHLLRRDKMNEDIRRRMNEVSVMNDEMVKFIGAEEEGTDDEDPDDLEWKKMINRFDKEEQDDMMKEKSPEYTYKRKGDKNVPVMIDEMGDIEHYLDVQSKLGVGRGAGRQKLNKGKTKPMKGMVRGLDDDVFL